MARRASGPRPTSSAVSRSLGGLNIRDDLSASILPRLTFSPTIGIAAGRIDKLGLDIRSFREPLKRSIQRVVAPSIQTNFAVGGRPGWEPLSQSTLEIRAKFGFGGGSSPLIRTGLLQRTMGQLNIWDINENSAVLSHLPDKVWYGAIHQEGMSSGMRTKIKKAGSASKAMADIIAQQREAMRTGKAIGGRSVSIPQRQFVLLQESDVDDIERVFAEWLDERINAAWPEGA